MKDFLDLQGRSGWTSFQRLHTNLLLCVIRIISPNVTAIYYSICRIFMQLWNCTVPFEKNAADLT